MTWSAPAKVQMRARSRAQRERAAAVRVAGVARLGPRLSTFVGYRSDAVCWLTLSRGILPGGARLIRCRLFLVSRGDDAVA
jgi:hypothetical protein